MRANYVIVSGLLFGLIAVFQIIRAVNQWPVQVGRFEVPVLASWLVAAVAAGMSLWAFRSRG